MHWTGVNGGSPSEVSEKNKRNPMIKKLRSLDMKYYLATGGLSSVRQPSNNKRYYAFMKIRPLIGRRIRIGRRLFYEPSCESALRGDPLSETTDRKIKKKEDR